MSRIAQLREQLKNKAIECRRMLDNSGNAALPKADQERYDSLTIEINDLHDAIAQEQKLLDLMADEHFKDVTPANKSSAGPVDVHRSGYRNWLQNGLDGLTKEEMAAYRNTMSTTTGSEGGFTVPSLIASSLITSLKNYSSMRNVAELLTTQSGGPLAYPTSDGTAEVGEIVPENTNATALDVTFGTAALNCYKFSSKVVAVPIELLMDSGIDIEAMVNARLSERIGRINNQLFTTGTGTSQPFGIVTRASSGTVLATGKTTTFDYDDLVNLQESIDDSYNMGGNAKFMMSQAARRVLRKLKDTSGRPIWTPGYELGATAGIPDLLMGSQVVINNDMAAPAANAKSIIYGDLRRYMIRDSMQVSLFRFTDSAYTQKGQIGFLAWARSGGNLLDTSAVKFLQHSAS